ncbi:MAG: AMP-binding protein [Opitutales bacterium]
MSALEINYARVIVDLVADELARQGGGSVLTGPLAALTTTTRLDEDSLGIDSLRLLHLAGAVNELFHLHETMTGDYLFQHREISAWAEIVRQSRAEAGEYLTFRTSGSTGEPRACTHRQVDLEAEVEVHVAHFGEVRRVLSFVPAHHIYGFIFNVLWPAQTDLEFVDARRRPAGVLQSDFRPGDLLVATPSFWDYLSRSLGSLDGLQGVTSGAPCPPALFSRLGERGLALTELYGSSETAGIGRRTEPTAPFRLLPHWERAGDSLVRSAAASEAVTVTSPVRLPDRLDWVDEQHFHLAGRTDGAVQVGGINVYPARIEARLAQHPTVAECAVRLMRPSEGERLKAFIVPHADASPTDAPELERWLRTEFTTAERPVSITWGDALPRNEMGKTTDWHVSPS